MFGKLVKMAIGTMKDKMIGFFILSIWIIIFTLYLDYKSDFQIEFRDDSYSYIDLASNFQLSNILSHERTIVYPLFLKSIETTLGNLDKLPLIQYVLFLSAVIFFYICLLLCKFDTYLSLFVTIPLLHLIIIHEHFNLVVTESVTVTLCIVTIGFLIISTMNLKYKFSWIGLCVFLFLTYQTRPAMLFYVVLVPISGTIFLFLFHRPSPFLFYTKYFSFLLIISFIPLLIFTGVRFFLGKGYGVSSFEGKCLAGIALNFLKEKEINAMPKEIIPLATEIYKIRKINYPEYNPKVSKYEEWNYNYNYNLQSAKSALINNSFESLEFNKNLREISIFIIKRNLSSYFRMVLYTFTDSFGKMFLYRYLDMILFFIIFILSISSYILHINIVKKSDYIQKLELFIESKNIKLLTGLFFLAIFNYFLGLFPIMFFERALGRYIAAIDIFFPSLFSGLSFLFWHQIISSYINKKNIKYKFIS